MQGAHRFARGRMAARLAHRLAVTGADVGAAGLDLEIHGGTADADVGARGTQLPAAIAEDRQHRAADDTQPGLRDGKLGIAAHQHGVLVDNEHHLAVGTGGDAVRADPDITLPAVDALREAALSERLAHQKHRRRAFQPVAARRHFKLPRTSAFRARSARKPSASRARARSSSARSARTNTARRPGPTGGWAGRAATALRQAPNTPRGSRTARSHRA